MNNLKALLQQEIATLDFVAHDFKLEQFNGGTVNSSYCLKTQGQRYFVKTFESDQIAQLDRAKLFSIQRDLALKGLSVNPLYLSKSGRFQIDEWSGVATLDKVSASELSIVKKLAATLSAIHSVQIDVPALDLPAQWAYYAQLLAKGLTQDEQDKLQRFTPIWEQACQQRSVFCHNDLALSHVTYHSPTIVFDWEYCAHSCPYFDLASCIAVNGLSQTNEASLCALYAQHQNLALSEVVENVVIMKPLVELTYKLWYQSAKQVV